MTNDIQNKPRNVAPATKAGGCRIPGAKTAHANEPKTLIDLVSPLVAPNGTQTTSISPPSKKLIDASNKGKQEVAAKLQELDHFGQPSKVKEVRRNPVRQGRNIQQPRGVTH